MRKVRTQDAVGSILCHDITKIVPGEFKGRAFKKGHVITENDIPELMKLGKEHLYVWEQQEGWLHEDQAAERLAKAVSGPNIRFGTAKEGRINLLADCSGLFTVDRRLLEEVDAHDQIILVTRHGNVFVKEGEILAGTRIVPLVIEEERIKAVETLCLGRNVLQVKPLAKFKVGLVTTGSEVYYGRIKDAFGPVLRQKFAEYGSEVVAQVLVPDDLPKITTAIRTFLAQGVDMIAVSGGMSVDPDDLTPGAIKAAGVDIVGYGAPILPGSQFLLGYFDDVPVVGLPGCVMYSQVTVFDLFLPRILAGEKITKQDMVQLAYGGLCLQCAECKYPLCPFGKA